MPIYEYECEGCGRIVEHFYRSIPRNNPNIIRAFCECMGEKPVNYRRVLSAPTFAIKGYSEANGYSDQFQDGSKVVSITEPED